MAKGFDYRVGEIYSWAEIFKFHRTRCGIYQRNEQLISLLTDFGLINPCYPDKFNEETPNQILYTGNGRRGDQLLSSPNRALLGAIQTKNAVPLFNKLGIGRWQLTGFWRVTAGEYVYDANQKRMIWQFTLERS
ncbi:MAG: hypothetical protein M3209_18715 [Acidobacteriota bacterium]|nr:hypothetical protein [Acidobacteriota bacterium]